MQDTSLLFENEFSVGMFHDAVIDSHLTLDFGIPENLDNEVLLDVFNSLPMRIRTIAHNFGLDDTEFRDAVVEHIGDGLTAFKSDIIKDAKQYNVGYSDYEDKDAIMVDVYLDPEEPIPYIRIPMKKHIELTTYLATAFPA